MAGSRAVNSVRNMISGVLYQILMLVLSFVSRTIFIYTLGTEFLGLNGIFSDVLQLLSMADLGFGTAMAYSFYQPLAVGNHDKIKALIYFYKRIYRIIAIAVLTLGICCIPFLGFFVRTQQVIPHLTIYYLFSLAGVVVSYLFVYKTTLMTADQKNYKLVKINMWVALLRTALQIVVLILLHSYIGYLAIGMFAQFASNLFASKKTEKEYPYITDISHVAKVDQTIQKGIVANMKSVVIYKFSSVLFSATDNIIISMVAGTMLVGVYSNYLMLSNKLLLLEQLIFSSLTASIGNVIVKENAQKKGAVFQAMQSVSFIFCGIISSIFCLMANDMIRVWLGESFLLSNLTVIAIALNTYLCCVLLPLWVYRDASGLYQRTKYMMLIGAVINILLSFFLGRIMGICGVLFASAIARVSTYLWYEPKLLYQIYFKQKVGGYYLSIIGNLFLVVITVMFLSVLTARIPVVNWKLLFVKGAVVGIVCSMIFLCAYARTQGFQMIWNKFKTTISKHRVAARRI